VQGEFFTDLKTQSAVLHQLTVLGEAVKRLSPSFRTQHPILPWSLIAGMRDHLIHGYDVVDLEEVWNTASNDIPEVLAKITPLLPEQPQIQPAGWQTSLTSRYPQLRELTTDSERARKEAQAPPGPPSLR
jgi:uncharacterized protein with HEPN domain